MESKAELFLNTVQSNSWKLNMHVVYRAVALRDQLLKLPFAHGINMAHNGIQEIVGKLK
jgi:hypothetical protein